MKNSTSNNLNEKKCGSKKTDIINKEGTLVFSWQRDPFRNGTIFQMLLENVTENTII
jgi:hypothetical protein